MDSLGVAHPAAKLRQACAHEHDRELRLLDAVHRRDEHRQLVLRHVLQLVDEDRYGGAGNPRCLTDLLEERLQVVLEVAVVGQAGLGLVVQADLEILILECVFHAIPDAVPR